jgi:hypothetical protein
VSTCVNFGTQKKKEHCLIHSPLRNDVTMEWVAGVGGAGSLPQRQVDLRFGAALPGMMDSWSNSGKTVQHWSEVVAPFWPSGGMWSMRESLILTALRAVKALSGVSRA